MTHYRIFLISVLCLNGCTPEHIDHPPSVAGLKSPTDLQPDCSQNGRVLNCDWNNVTDDWLDADPSEFNDQPPEKRGSSTHTD